MVDQERLELAREASKKNPEVLEALKGSIEKWKMIASGKGRDEGCDNCPLCQLFRSETGGGSGPDCEDGCPVYLATGFIGCSYTPYWGWTDVEPRLESGCCIMHIDDAMSRPKAVAAALEEVKFLESLLPEGEST